MSGELPLNIGVAIPNSSELRYVDKLSNDSKRKPIISRISESSH